MSTYAPSPSAYRANAVMTASPGQLVVMLYDGARRFLHQASVAMGERQGELAHRKLSSAEDIVRHLRNTLDMEQGEVSVRLKAIYTFCLRQMSEARLAQDPAKLIAVDRLLGQLRDSWNSIAAE
jgi:flagellar secretion chaperone FliS